MREINGHRFYEEQDILDMLYRLNYVTRSHRDYIKREILNGNYGMDTIALINIVDDPMEYNIDYLYSLDSEVTEQFIRLMERFGYT